MDHDDVFERIISILKPFTKNSEALAKASAATLIEQDLRINSARLVDLIIEIEERFEIQVKNEDADRLRTVGDAVDLVLAKR